MPSTCTIVMYHYVRELRRTRFPEIKGLDLSLFKAQLGYMQRFYQFVTAQDLIEACHSGRELPANAAYLTFDDGYADHFLNAFPVLDQLGIEGAFFPPVCAIRDGRVLDVNKIHFVLASAPSVEGLLEQVYDQLNRLRSAGHEIESNEALYARLAVDGAFDPAPVIFIKRLLQRELEQRLRNQIVDALFQHFVTDNERAFAAELYLSEDQISTMLRHGMRFGSHGYEHRWMDTLSEREQLHEIDASLEFLQDVGSQPKDWLMCYPYGAHDERLRDICAKRGCALGFTTNFGLAELAACRDIRG